MYSIIEYFYKKKEKVINWPINKPIAFKCFVLFKINNKIWILWMLRSKECKKYKLSNAHLIKTNKTAYVSDPGPQNQPLGWIF